MSETTRMVENWKRTWYQHHHALSVEVFKAMLNGAWSNLI